MSNDITIALLNVSNVCNGNEYYVNPDAPEEGTDIYHRADDCPVHGPQPKPINSFDVGHVIALAQRAADLFAELNIASFRGTEYQTSAYGAAEKCVRDLLSSVFFVEDTNDIIETSLNSGVKIIDAITYLVEVGRITLPVISEDVEPEFLAVVR